MRSKWIYSQWFYFEPTVGGELRIFGFYVKLARREGLGGGVPLVGPQEELRGPNGYIPRGFTSSPPWEAN